MDKYSKIRNPWYRIELARAERVGLMSAAMAADNAMGWAQIEMDYLSPFETPEGLLEDLTLQDEMLKELDRLVGQMVNEAVFKYILCAPLRPRR